jgi:hypothetical protein
MRSIAIRAALGAAVLAAALAGPAGAEPAPKVLLCHGTASETNPYVLVSVSENALAGHFDGTAPGHGKNNHPDFLLPAGQTTCERGGEHGGEGGWQE